MAAGAVLLPVGLGPAVEAGEAGVARLPRGARMTWALGGSALLLAVISEVRDAGLLGGAEILRGENFGREAGPDRRGASLALDGLPGFFDCPVT